MYDVLQRHRRGGVLWLDLLPDGTTHRARWIESSVIDMMLGYWFHL